MVIQSTRVWIAGEFTPAQLQIESGAIERILPHGTLAPDADYGDLRIVPGFIDIHTHGGYGFDVNSADPDGLCMWRKEVTKEGVTTVLPTTLTSTKDVLMKAVQNVYEVKKASPGGEGGADLYGIHLEGPFLDEQYCGAQPPGAIVPPSVEEFEDFQKACGNLIKVVTIAPEHDRDHLFTRYASSHGTVVSVGHTSASYEEVLLAFANGASSLTHTYNAMSRFHHRENGAVGFAFRMHDQYSEVICDCLHSTPEALNIFFSCKDDSHAVMISDSLMAKGSPAGSRFLFGPNEIYLDEQGTARLADPKARGTIAGSTLSINIGLKNLVERALVPFPKALRSCTANPAALLGIGGRKGKICARFDADLAVLEDDYSVRQTYCMGVPQLP